VIRAVVHGVDRGKVYIVSGRVRAGIRRWSKRERARGGDVDWVYLLDQSPFTVVQGDTTNSDYVQQRSLAVVQPGDCAWLATVADSGLGRVDDI